MARLPGLNNNCCVNADLKYYPLKRFTSFAGVHIPSLPILSINLLLPSPVMLSVKAKNDNVPNSIAETGRKYNM